VSQQRAAEYLRHGQTPFFRLPAVEDYRGAGAVLLGAPYDGGTTYQPGARFAPYHVRRVSALVQSYHPSHRIDVFERLRAVDGGNVVFPPFDAQAVRACIEREVASVIAAGARPFLVGGDHTVALPALRAAAAAHGPLAVVHIDAHADTSGPEVWGDAWHHGTPLRHALDEKLIAARQLYQIGLRGPLGSRDDFALAASHDASIYTIDAVAERGPPAIASEVRARIGDRAAWLTFDIDAVDPAFAPATGTPVPGGLSSREAIALLRGLAGVRLVGMDLVEVLPALDVADLTSHLAAHLLYEGLALGSLR